MDKKKSRLGAGALDLPWIGEKKKVPKKEKEEKAAPSAAPKKTAAPDKKTNEALSKFLVALPMSLHGELKHEAIDRRMKTGDRFFLNDYIVEILSKRKKP